MCVVTPSSWYSVGEPIIRCSIKQRAANQQNAQKSTGPRTEEGKAVSRLNALRHGLTCRDVLILPHEDPKAFYDLRKGLQAALRPEGQLEEVLVERIALCSWRLQRVSRIETGMILRGIYEALAEAARQEARRHVRDPVLEDPFFKGEVVNPAEYDRASAEAERFKRLRDGDEGIEGQLFLRQENGTKFCLLNRYETGIERSLYRALQELQRLQAARAP